VDPLTQAEVQNLRRIMATAGVLPGEARSAVGESIPTGDSLEAGWARHELNGWTGAVQSADTVLGTLAVTVAQLMKQTEGLQRQGEEALRKVSEPLEDDDINSRLVELQSQYSKLEADTQQALANCAARAGQLARRQADLRRTPWWLRWVYALVPTDWFGPNGSGK
jgi:chromosome segregation ATPase